jgi:flagellar biosynthesis GTPase FlhF
MPNEAEKSKKPLAVLAVVLLLCGLVAGLLVLKSRRAKASNVAPLAALRLDSIDESNRVATLSDGGSHDPDGTIQSWRIGWGDGKEESLSSMPQKAPHTYASEGEYTISLWCVDNLGATSSPPAMTNITFDFLKKQKALELAQAEEKRAAEAKRLAEEKRAAEAMREAERIKEEEAKKQAERLEQERQKQRELAAQEAQKAKEKQEFEAKQRAEAELAQQKAQEAAKPPPVPLAASLAEKPSSKLVRYTPPGYELGEFQILKEKTEGKADDGNVLVTLVTRCVNFPDTPLPTSDWQIDGKRVQIEASRIRLSLSPGKHDIRAIFAPKGGFRQRELKVDLTVEPNGECVIVPRK